MKAMIGTTLGHYRIVEKIGEGGMGEVHRAEDTKLGLEVALKFLPPEWSRDPAERERFLREARAAHHVAHPNQPISATVKGKSKRVPRSPLHHCQIGATGRIAAS